jgi:hypothetical protein
MKKILVSFGVITTLLFSTSSQAQNIWAAKIGGTLNDRCNAVTTDASGNVYMTGWFQGTVDFNPGAATNSLTAYGNYDCFVLKLDVSGNYVWVKQLGGTSNDIGNGITVDASGNVYLTGSFEGTCDFDPGTGSAALTAPGGNSDAFICKLTSAGAYSWAKKIGDTNLEEGFGIVLDASNNVYTTGYFSSTTVDFNPGTGTSNITCGGFNDCYISKLDASGNYVWGKAITGPNYEVGNALTVDGSGNVIITGYFRSSVDFDPGTGSSFLTSAGWSDIFICKLTSTGTLSWAKRIGDINYEEGKAITADATGDIYITGYFMNAPDFDPGTGTTTLTSAGGYDVYVGKYSSTGTLVWVKSFGASTEDNVLAIDLDASGNVYTTGYFYSATDFNPGAGTFTLTPVGNNDAFISKLDAAGNFVWAKKMGGTSFDFGTSLTIDVSGSVIAAGYFQGTGDFDPGSPVYNLTSAGSYDMFITKSQNTTGVSGDDAISEKLIVYPNPATEKISIKGERISSIEIYSVTGQRVKTEITNNTDEVSILLTGLENGFYFVRIMEEKRSNIVTFVKQ